MKIYTEIINHPNFIKKQESFKYRGLRKKEDYNKYLIKKQKAQNNFLHLLDVYAKELETLSIAYNLLVDKMLIIDSEQKEKAYIENVLYKREVYLMKKTGLFINLKD